jgi:hypothetical protein
MANITQCGPFHLNTRAPDQRRRRDQLLNEVLSPPNSDFTLRISTDTPGWNNRRDPHGQKINPRAGKFKNDATPHHARALLDA